MARAVAVLGESADLPAVAELAELAEQQVADASGALARAEILGPGVPARVRAPAGARGRLPGAVGRPARADARARRHACCATPAPRPTRWPSHLLSMARRGDRSGSSTCWWRRPASAVRRSRARQRRGLPHPRAGGAADARPARADPARSRHLRHEHLRPAGAGAPGRGLRAARGSPQARHRGVAPVAHADLRGQPRGCGGVRPAGARRASAGAPRRAQRARGRGADLGVLRRRCGGRPRAVEASAPGAFR